MKLIGGRKMKMYIGTPGGIFAIFCGIKSLRSYFFVNFPEIPTIYGTNCKKTTGEIGWRHTGIIFGQITVEITETNSVGLLNDFLRQTLGKKSSKFLRYLRRTSNTKP